MPVSKAGSEGIKRVNMNKISRIVIALVILFSAGLAYAEFVDKIVAVVNDDVVTQSEVDAILAPVYIQYSSLYQAEELSRKMLEAREKLIKRLIEDKLILAEAERRGVEVVVTSKKLWENRRQDLPPAISPINREIGVLNHPRPQKWQTDIPLGRSWAYTPRVGCKDPNDLVDLIVSNVSKNGLTFFSVAPKADGSLPEAQVEGLKKLGDWMAINKPALYATVPAPFDLSGTDAWKAGSLRFTRKKEYLYAIDLEKPTAPLVIPGVRPLEGSEIKMLGSDKSLKWHMEEGEEEEDDEQRGNLVIEEIPDPLPCDYAWSFKIQILDKSW